MAEIVPFPDRMGNTEIFELGDGASVTLTATDGRPLTVQTAVYMLEFTKAAIIKMMDA